LSGAAAHAEVISIDTVTVGNPGNAPDTRYDPSGYGGVDYEYRISKYEVTNAQYVEFLNATAATDTYALYDTSMASSTRGGITRSGSSGSYTYSVKADALGQGPGGGDYGYADKPVVEVSWYDAVRFANWLTSGDTESGTYAISGGGPDSGSVAIPDHSTFAAGSNTFFLPSEDEWYKAAYYDGGSSTYFDYATGTDTAPNNNLPSADTGNSANFDDGGYTTGDSSYPLTGVGSYGLSASPYGTFDQGGNVYEWNEALVSGSGRSLRGGAWLYSTIRLTASHRRNGVASSEGSDVGFRIASSQAIPEPSTLASLGGLLGMGMIGAWWRRRRKAA
jgi:formylglycine-generating enzyme required for sulfatase activity